MAPEASSGGLTLAPPGAVQLGGLLGEALAANHRGRLSTFITNATSPAIALFDPARARENVAGDWYGEHAGKWLYAAARAAFRTNDAALRERVQRVADFLVSVQADDGYLGTYAPERRFMRKQPPKPPSWDGAPFARTWDVWVHTYVVLGLLEAHRYLGMPRYLEAARRIGDLCWNTLTAGGIDITDLGNHHGMSATVLIDAAVELYAASGERRYLDLARLVLEQADRHPRLALLRQLAAGTDASEIGTGKAYQLLWNLVGLTKLHRATGESKYLQAALNGWHSIGAHHLTLDGGPWGGSAHRSREVFNAANAFDRHGYVETCSTLAWIQLNRELLSITGEPAYAQEIERSAYNALLGAQAPNGEDWCYYSFPNGRRVHTTYWRCCKSSGAMALEELPSIAYGLSRDDGIKVNLYSPSAATLDLRAAGAVRVEQRTRYPFEGEVKISLTPQRESEFRMHLRIPEWAQGAKLRVNDDSVGAAPEPGTYAVIERRWRAGDTITLEMPMRPRAHRRTHRNVQESVVPDGSSVQQEVLHLEFLAVTRGPLAYATSLIDGYKTEETLRIDVEPEEKWLQTVPAQDGADGVDVRLRPVGRDALTFSPYYRAGGRRDGAWRLTWMSLAPE
jgi:DUF1680 family protein